MVHKNDRTFLHEKMDDLAWRSWSENEMKIDDLKIDWMSVPDLGTRLLVDDIFTGSDKTASACWTNTENVI